MKKILTSPLTALLATIALWIAAGTAGLTCGSLRADKVSAIALEVPYKAPVVLTFGQKVILNDGFFKDTPAVVVNKIRPDKYVVSTLEGPIMTTRINPKITLPPPQRGQK